MNTKQSDFNVSITNYQRLSKANLTFNKGINIITGESNNGKTAILRAIRAAIFNIPNEDHIQDGKDKATVSIQYKGADILWERDKSKSSQVTYTVNGELFQKVGRNALSNVTNALGISRIEIDDLIININFQSQLEFPFLLDKTSAQLYKVFTQTGNKLDYTSIISKMKYDAQELKEEYNTELKYRDKIQGELILKNSLLESVLPCQDSINAFFNLESDVGLCDSLELITASLIDNTTKSSALTTKVNYISKVIDKLQTNYSQLESNFISLEKLSCFIDNSNLYKACKTKLENIILSTTDLEDLYNNLVNKQSLLEVISTTITLQQSKDIIEEQISCINSISINSEDVKLYYLLHEFIIQYTHFKELSDSLNKCTEELKEAEAKRNEFKICPLCGQVIDSQHHEEV